MLRLVPVILLLAFTAHAQEVDLSKGDLSILKEEKSINIEFLFEKLGVGDFSKEADYIKKNVTKPVYGYIAGHHAPAGVQLGHAGAILGSEAESAAAKSESLKQSGVHTSTSIGKLINSVKWYTYDNENC